MHLLTTAIRPAFLRVHRYFGLALALFLIVLGLTGSLLAFYHEVDAWLNPQLFQATAQGKPLSPDTLVRRIEQADPRVRVRYMPVEVKPGHAVETLVDARVNPTTGKLYPVDYDEVFIDPVSGEILGQRHWGAFRVDRVHLMPFIYVLHERLHLPLTWGIWLIGAVALIWALDCLIALYLTFPHGRISFRKWGPAWKVKTNAGALRLNYDLHRAGGLWPWLLLLMLAISGVALNLHSEVFKPVVSFFSPITPSIFDTREMRPPEDPIPTKLSFHQVLTRAKLEAEQRGWPKEVIGIFYAAEFGVFGVGFGEEHPVGLGSPWLYLDGASGRPVDADVPGVGTAGDIFDQLQYPLHSGQIAGLPGRILICLSGVVVAMLSITGIIIWLRKRYGAARQSRGREAPARGISPVAVSAAQR
jgi:uncharacterized iron-regulated membrane protein